MADIPVIVVVSLQGAIFGLFTVAVRRSDIAAATNALGSFVLTLLPALIELALQVTLSRSVSFGPVLSLWIAVAGVLHSLGMLRLYELTWWWDHLTHTVSAALIAALLYAGVIVTLPNTVVAGNSSGTVIAVTVVFTFAIGVFWELIELVAREVGERFDIEPVLVHYGWRDTVVDLGFDIVGALLVTGADLRIFVPTIEQFPGVTETMLVGSGWIVLVGSVLMALFIGFGGSVRA